MCQGEPTADPGGFTINGMNTMLFSHKRPRTTRLLLYGLAITLIVLSPVLGMVAAAIAVWQSLAAGSIWYMPMGLTLVLAAIALVQSHKLFDLVLLGLVVVALIAWFAAGTLQQDRLLDGILTLSRQPPLLVGVLCVMIPALVLIHMVRRRGRW